jgi:hypothetical protein
MDIGHAPPCTAVKALSTEMQLGLSDVEMAFALSSPWAAGSTTVCFSCLACISSLLSSLRLLRFWKFSFVRSQTVTPSPPLIISFEVAMLLFPSKMKLAQAEIDKHVGRARLPEFSDLQSLVYVDALIKETLRWARKGITGCSLFTSLRWRPIFPLAIPHSLTEDDTYEGMFIPKVRHSCSLHSIVLIVPEGEHSLWQPTVSQ